MRDRQMMSRACLRSDPVIRYLLADGRARARLALDRALTIVAIYFFRMQLRRGIAAVETPVHRIEAGTASAGQRRNDSPRRDRRHAAGAAAEAPASSRSARS